MENLIITFSSKFWKQDKRCMEDWAGLPPSISMWQSQSFMQRTAVVCCWQGTVWKSHSTYRVCVHVRSSILSVHDSLSTRDESVVTCYYVTWWNKRKRSKQTLSSSDRLRCQIVLSVCVWAGDDFLQDCACSETDSAGEITCTPAPGPSSLHLFATFISQWHSVFMCTVPVGLHDPNAPALPPSPRHPLSPFPCRQQC